MIKLPQIKDSTGTLQRVIARPGERTAMAHVGGTGVGTADVIAVEEGTGQDAEELFFLDGFRYYVRGFDSVASEDFVSAIESHATVWRRAGLSSSLYVDGAANAYHRGGLGGGTTDVDFIFTLDRATGATTNSISLDDISAALPAHPYSGYTRELNGLASSIGILYSGAAALYTVAKLVGANFPGNAPKIDSNEEYFLVKITHGGVITMSLLHRAYTVLNADFTETDFSDGSPETVGASKIWSLKSDTHILQVPDAVSRMVSVREGATVTLLGDVTGHLPSDGPTDNVSNSRFCADESGLFCAIESNMSGLGERTIRDENLADVSPTWLAGVGNFGECIGMRGDLLCIDLHGMYRISDGEQVYPWDGFTSRIQGIYPYRKTTWVGRTATDDPTNNMRVHITEAAARVKQADGFGGDHEGQIGWLQHIYDDDERPYFAPHHFTADPA